jgi:two-component system sensor histidine kinase KdpD
MANFFTEKNLLRLRELTLTEVARFLDSKQRAEAEQEVHQPALGLVAVAISSRGPDPGALLRKTARLAAQLNAPWFAVYVRTPSEAPAKIDSEVQRRVTDTLETAQKMGGTVIVLKNEEVSAALESFAREYGLTHLVLGRPGGSRKWWRLRPPLHDKLIVDLKEVDIIIG